MLNKTRSDNQTLQLNQLKKRLAVLESIVPEEKRAEINRLLSDSQKTDDIVITEQ